jgi:hypothetical protein
MEAISAINDERQRQYELGREIIAEVFTKLEGHRDHLPAYMMRLMDKAAKEFGA